MYEDLRNAFSFCCYFGMKKMTINLNLNLNFSKKNISIGDGTRALIAYREILEETPAVH